MPWRNPPRPLSAPPASPRARKQLERKTPLRSDPEKRREFLNRAQRRTATSQKRRPVSPASPRQRLAVLGRPCLVCAGDGVDPMHLIDRSLCPEGADDPRAVVPACRSCHTLYDDDRLDLLPHLEPRFRVELAFAVERLGLISTLERVTGESWRPLNPTVAA